MVTLDFPSLIDRITRSFNYEACLLGFVNDDLDPDAQMTVWLSSVRITHGTRYRNTCDCLGSRNRCLMHKQASTLGSRKRKEAIDRVQEIVWQQEPFIYLVNKDAAVSCVDELAQCPSGRASAAGLLEYRATHIRKRGLRNH